MRWLAAAIGVLLAAPTAAPAATIEVQGGVLKVVVPGISGGGTMRNGAVVNPLPGGGAIVGLYGNVPVALRTTGAGCGSVAAGNAPGTVEFGGATFAATCDLTGVVGVEGSLIATTGSQLWRSALILPTKVSAASSPTGSLGAAQEGGDTITTGPGSDTINAGAKSDVIDPGGATYKGQEPVPGTTGAFEDKHFNVVTAGAGDDTITLTFGTGRDIVNGGAGVDGVTYAGRFGIGFPGQAGVNVSLNDVADDGDPNIDPPDSTAPGEGDNVKADVENVTGTKREDVLVGNSSRNRLDGGEAKDTLTGGSGEDALMAREPSTAGAGIKDTIDCGSPAASFRRRHSWASASGPPAPATRSTPTSSTCRRAQAAGELRDGHGGAGEGGSERRRGRERDADRGGQAEGARALPARRRPYVCGNAAAGRAKRQGRSQDPVLHPTRKGQDGDRGAPLRSVAWAAAASPSAWSPSSAAATDGHDGRLRLGPNGLIHSPPWRWSTAPASSSRASARR